MAKKIVRAEKSLGVTVGSGNVFADLDLPNPDELLAKSILTSEIVRLVRQAKLTQKQVAARLAIDQLQVSALLRGRLGEFSTERLIRCLVALDSDVLIVVRPAKAKHGQVRVLRESELSVA